MHSDTTLLLRNTLDKRIHKDVIELLSHHANRDACLRNKLVRLVFDENQRIANNATWVLTHCSKETLYNLEKRQHDFISRCLSTADTTQHRLLLTILSRQHPPKKLHSSLFNRCLDGIQDPSVAPGTQALYIRLAHQWSLYDKDLHQEFCHLINYMDTSLCSPAVLSAIQHINSSQASAE